MVHCSLAVMAKRSTLKGQQLRMQDTEQSGYLHVGSKAHRQRIDEAPCGPSELRQGSSHK